MKRFLLTGIFLLAGYTMSFAQENNNVMRTYDGPYVIRQDEIPFANINDHIHVTYSYTLDSHNKRVRQGECIYEDNSYRIEGQYIDNMKTGLWTMYSGSGESIGYCSYSENRLNGVFDLNYDVKSVEYHATAVFCQGALVDKLTIKSESENLEAYFDKGLAAGKWIISKVGDIYKMVIGFEDGKCISIEQYDDSRGEYQVINDVSLESVLPLCLYKLFEFFETRLPSYKTVGFSDFNIYDVIEKIEDMVVPFSELDVKPTFLGGDASTFNKWFQSQLVYPEKALSKGIQGTVIMQFEIDKNGNLVNAEIIHGVDESLDNEVLRVLSISPKWNPAIQK